MMDQRLFKDGSKMDQRKSDIPLRFAERARTPFLSREEEQAYDPD
jgi:hypothetical protein